ncbi:MAG: transcriptional regulator [Thaumarchaeota archaeon]|nr:MAG: transcriptional regulator [Nitrososphaerota archaeon]
MIFVRARGEDGNESGTSKDEPIRRRSSLEIAADMLEAARKGARKTSIMYRANLSHALLQSYLGVLVGEELLNRSGEPERFHLSEKGSKLLRHLQELKRLERADNRKLELINELLPSNR